MKKNIFLLLLILVSIVAKSQNVGCLINTMSYEITCNNYNALYYNRTNEMTIKYDTVKYKGEILFDFDTSYFKNVVRKDKYKYVFSIDYHNMDSPTYNKILKFYYKENGNIYNLEGKEILVVDTNIWFAKLVSDKFIMVGKYIYTFNFLDYLESEIDKGKVPQMVYFVKNDQIVNNYKSLNYCISAIMTIDGRNHTKLCVVNSNYDGELMFFLRHLSHINPIFIENIEVIDSQGEKKYFPPMSFQYN